MVSPKTVASVQAKRLQYPVLKVTSVLQANNTSPSSPTMSRSKKISGEEAGDPRRRSRRRRKQFQPTFKEKQSPTEYNSLWEVERSQHHPEGPVMIPDEVSTHVLPWLLVSAQ